MKLLCFFVVFFLVPFVSSSNDGYISFSAPERGDLWVSGEAYSIIWQPNTEKSDRVDNGEAVELYLVKSSGKRLHIDVGGRVIRAYDQIKLQLNKTAHEADDYTIMAVVVSDTNKFGSSEPFSIINEGYRSTELSEIESYERQKKISEGVGIALITLLYVWVVYYFNKQFYGNVKGGERTTAAPLSSADGDIRGEGRQVETDYESGDVSLRFRLLRFMYTDFKRIRLHRNERPLLETVTADDLAIRFTAWRVWTLAFAILPFSLLAGLEVSDSIFTVVEADLVLDNPIMDVGSSRLRSVELLISACYLACRLVALSFLLVSVAGWRGWNSSAKYLRLFWVLSSIGPILIYLLPWAHFLNLKPISVFDFEKLSPQVAKRATSAVHAYVDLLGRVTFLSAAAKEIGPVLVAIAPAIQGGCLLVRSAFPGEFWIGWIISLTPLLYLPSLLTACVFLSQLISDYFVMAGVIIIAGGQILYVLSWNITQSSLFAVIARGLPNSANAAGFENNPLAGRQRSFLLLVKLVRLITSVMGIVLFVASYFRLSGPITSAVANNSLGVFKMFFSFVGNTVVIKVITTDWLLDTIRKAIEAEERSGMQVHSLDMFRSGTGGLAALVKHDIERWGARTSVVSALDDSLPAGSSSSRRGGGGRSGHIEEESELVLGAGHNDEDSHNDEDLP